MVIESHVDCISCIVNHANELADKYLDNKKEKYEFINKVLKIIIETDYDRTAPIITANMMRLLQEYKNQEDFFIEEKRTFNQKMLDLSPKFNNFIKSSDQPLKTALKLSITGNIIDIGALNEVNDELINEAFKKSEDEKINQSVFNEFMNDLKDAESLLYIGDNAGEIVLDKLFINEIKKAYPSLDIYYAVRGKPTFNDVTIEDAKFIKMEEVAEVIDNGTDLPGTDLLEVKDEFLKVFNNSDVIISKGQGNYESLSGCNKNVYYLLLCKCEMLQRKLNKDFLESVFLHEEYLKKQ